MIKHDLQSWSVKVLDDYWVFLVAFRRKRGAPVAERRRQCLVLTIKMTFVAMRRRGNWWKRSNVVKAMAKTSKPSPSHHHKQL